MISIIIPAYNEAGHIGQTIRMLKHLDNSALVQEIIVADGGSKDDTCLEARAAGARPVQCPRKGRAAQMNWAASAARGEVFYFLHADSIPPAGFARDIQAAIEQGYTSGCYRLRFDHRHWFLQANSWFTRFDVNWVRFGDQSLFVTRDVFKKGGGFREDLLVMEDQEIIGRLKRWGPFKVMKGAVTTSARKYLDNGIYRMQAIFFRIWFLYYMGYSQERLLKLYRKLIVKGKL
ncbi:MAG: TIGR04283 family arsenosugar biosynthesis glycosyltransferase [Williamsia sp.]|nr:TIGR04283 family arsenosugar biosynthesis glycosyltransferase [Williamsia sp.]